MNISGKPKGHGSHVRIVYGAIIYSLFQPHVHPKDGPAVHKIDGSSCGLGQQLRDLSP